jgi:hypothetical protein
MPLIYFIFDKEITKFLATKRLTKGLKDKSDALEDEEEKE